MSTIKTLLLATLLSAAAYGVYVTITGSPPSEPPKDAAPNWEQGAQVEMPGEALPGGETETPAATTQVVPPAQTDPYRTKQSPDPGGSAPPFVPQVGPATEQAAPEDPATPQFDPALRATQDPEPGATGAQGSPAAGDPSAEASTTYPMTETQSVYGGGADDSYDRSPTDATPGGERDPASDPYASEGRDQGSGRYASPDAYPSQDRYAEDNRYASGEQAAADERYSNESTESRTSFEQPSAGSQSEFASAMHAAQAQLDQGQLVEAHAALSEWYGDPRLSTDEMAQLVDLLDRLAGTIVYSRQHLLEPPYFVQPGDTLETVAEAYNVPWELLAKINGVTDPHGLRQGDELKVLRGPFDAVLELDQFRLTLFLQGRLYAGRFSVGLGKDQNTPEGELIVLGKIANPTYYGDVVIDADDPANPLGEYALDLGNHILIHGTNDPKSINRAESRGSIRLSPTDIVDVYDILSAQSERTAGSKVYIRR